MKYLLMRAIPLLVYIAILAVSVPLPDLWFWVMVPVAIGAGLATAWLLRRYERRRA